MLMLFCCSSLGACVCVLRPRIPLPYFFFPVYNRVFPVYHTGFFSLQLVFFPVYNRFFFQFTTRVFSSLQSCFKAKCTCSEYLSGYNAIIFFSLFSRKFCIIDFFKKTHCYMFTFVAVFMYKGMCISFIYKQ